MKLSSCRWNVRSFDLNRPLPGSNVQTRDVIHVELTAEDGRTSSGEIAPLPGFSGESLEQALVQLQELRPRLCGRPVDEQLLSATDLYPSVRCGLEAAAARLSERGAAWWDPTRIPSTQVCGLLDTLTRPGLDPETADSELTAALEKHLGNGTERIKLKVGRRAPHEDIRHVVGVCDRLPHGTMIRLDANRAWTFDEAEAFIAELDPGKVEFIEEPLNDPDLLPVLARRSVVPIGIDESVPHFVGPDHVVDSLEWVGVLVAKPMIRWAYEATFEIAAQLAELNIPVVVSSSFESALGIEPLFGLAARLPGPPMAAGLDTSRYFRGGTVDKHG